MCGIYGYIGTPSTKVLELFQNLGIASETRGTHATGYYGINGHVVSAKAPLKATDFFQTHQFQKLNENIPNILIGHNRFATHGSPKENKNNHPFVSSRFGFVHNGVVGQVKVDVETKSECDSEKVFRYFIKKYTAHHKRVRAIQETLKVFDSGSVACAMVDSVARCLYLFRNVGNPINFAKIDSLGILVFASTTEILKEGLKDSGITEDIKFWSIKKGGVIKVTENTEYRGWITKGLRDPYTSYYTKWVKPSATPTTYKYQNSQLPMLSGSNPIPQTGKIFRKQYVPIQTDLFDNSFKHDHFWVNNNQISENTQYGCTLCRQQFPAYNKVWEHLNQTHNIFHFVGDYIKFPFNLAK